MRERQWESEHWIRGAVGIVEFRRRESEREREKRRQSKSASWSVRENVNNELVIYNPPTFFFQILNVLITQLKSTLFFAFSNSLLYSPLRDSPYSTKKLHSRTNTGTYSHPFHHYYSIWNTTTLFLLTFPSFIIPVKLELKLPTREKQVEREYTPRGNTFLERECHALRCIGITIGPTFKPN